MKSFSKKLFICSVTLFICFAAVILYAAEPLNDLTPGEHVSLDGYPLSLDEAIRKALQNNFDIEVARIERKANVLELPITESMYDTTLSGKATYEVDQAEQPSSILPKKTNQTIWNVGVSKLFKWGTLLDLSFNNTRNSSPSTFSSLNPYYISDGVFSFTQPLLQNSFGYLDRSSVRLTQLDISRLDLDLVDRVEKNVYEVQQAYWNLALAYNTLEAKEEALQFAETFYSITKQQFDDGAVEETDLFAAEANVEQRRNDVLASKNSVENISDELQFAMNYFPDIALRPIELCSTERRTFNKDMCVSKALDLRRDLAMAKIQAEKENITLKMKKNSKLPELDLVGSFTANGLARDMIDAVGEAASLDDPTYFIGVEFSYPLENRKAISEFKQSELELAKKLWRIKQNEKEIYIEINKAIREIRYQTTNITNSSKIYDLQKKKLEGEEKKYKYGRSSSDIIIRFQNDVINAQIARAQAFAKYELSLINLKRSQNSILHEIDWITT